MLGRSAERRAQNSAPDPLLPPTSRCRAAPASAATRRRGSSRSQSSWLWRRQDGAQGKAPAPRRNRAASDRGRMHGSTHPMAGFVAPARLRGGSGARGGVSRLERRAEAAAWPCLQCQAVAVAICRSCGRGGCVAAAYVRRLRGSATAREAYYGG